jgi:hypothetical protein
MIELEKDTFVTIGLIGGQIIVGKIEKWSEEIIYLKSVNGKGITIITHPERDISFINYELTNNSEKIEEVKQILDNTNELWEETLKQPISDLKNKRLAELKILANKAEKDLIASKLKDHTIGEVKKVTYGTPQFLKKPST